MVAAWRWEGEQLHLTVRVQPRSANDQVMGMVGDELRVRLASPPVEGAANRALVRLLAREFRVPQRQVTLTAGERGRTKRVRVDHPRELPHWLPPTAAQGGA